MRPIRNPAKPPLRRRAPRLPGQSRALPGASRSPPGPAGPDAPARPLSSRCLGADTWARLRRPQARSARTTSHHHPPIARPRGAIGCGWGQAARRGRKARKATAISEDGLGAVWWDAACTCVCQCVRGAAVVCVRLSRVWHGRAGCVYLYGAGDFVGPGAAGMRRESPRCPRALRPSCSVRAARSPQAIRPLAGHPFSDFKAELTASAPPTPSPIPQPRPLRPARRPKVPPLPRAPGTRRPAQGPRCPVPCSPSSSAVGRGGGPPARPPRARPAALTGSCRWTG